MGSHVKLILPRRAHLGGAQHTEVSAEDPQPVSWPDPEPLSEPGPGLTDSHSWKVSDPGLCSVHYSNTRTCRGFRCAGHCLHPPPRLCQTPGSLSLGEGLLETAST